MARRTVNKETPILDHTNDRAYELSLALAFNHYNRLWNMDDYKKHAVSCVLSDRKIASFAPFVRKAEPLEVRSLAVWLTLRAEGQTLSKRDDQRIMDTLEALKEKYREKPIEWITIIPDDEPTPEEIKAKKVSWALHEACGIVEEYIDDLLAGKNVEPKFGTLLDDRNVLRSFTEWLETRKGEFVEATTDKEVGAWYSQPKKTLKAVLTALENLIRTVNHIRVSTKATKKKPQTPTQQTKRMNVIRSIPELKLVGKPASFLVGEKSLFVYYPDTRRLVFFVAQSGQSLGANGMSLTGYDLEKSLYKTVRNPEKFFSDLTITKGELRKRFGSFGGSGSNNVPMRLNNKCIILA